jgi:addiction module HigA family antidote
MATSDAYANLPTHPGEIIKKELQRRGISQRRVAIETTISPSQLNELINCKRPLTAEMAILLGRALDLDPEPLLTLQVKYDIEFAQRNRAFLIRMKRVLKIEDEAPQDA